MDFKKRKDSTPKKEDSTFSERRKNKSINKELFPGKFVSLFLFSNIGKIQLWLSSSTIHQFDFKNICKEKSVIETIISNNIKISSCLANGQVEIHLE